MRCHKNHYEILGIERSASLAEIKKRYRELARKHHPDVTSDKTNGAKDFIQITEAYKVLIDPIKRKSYDYTLPVEAAAPTRPSTASPRPHYSPAVNKLVKEAEMAFIKRKLEKAKELCREAIRIDIKCARAHAILGDIYRAKHQNDQAINEYNYAVQFNPIDHESQRKLEKLVGKSRPVKFSWDEPTYTLSKEGIFLNIVGWTIAVFLLLLLGVYPGKPIAWLASFHLTLIQNWSWNLVCILFGDGALIGFMLSVNGLVDHPDDVLIFERTDRAWALFPTGLVLMMFSPVFFLAAAVYYLIFGFAQQSISMSVVKVLIAASAIVLIAALVYPLDKASILLLGGNVAFSGMLVGWYVGSIARPE